MQLRSLALPFTVVEWTLPTVPRPVQNGPSRPSSTSTKDLAAVQPAGTSSPTKASSADPSGLFPNSVHDSLESLLVFLCLLRLQKIILIAEGASADGSQEEFSESFAFALVNGALGVFEVHGRRIRDFRYGYFFQNMYFPSVFLV